MLSDHKTRNSPTLLLILKWGGELTPAGRSQAEELGRAFRCMYPGGKGQFFYIALAKFLFRQKFSCSVCDLEFLDISLVLSFCGILL